MMGSRNIAYRISLVMMGCYILTALFSPFLAGDRPIVCKSENKWIFPFWSDTGMKNMQEKSDLCIMPLIPYSGGYEGEGKNFGLSPMHQGKNEGFRYRHWLGTDKLGRDVAAGMIHGCGIALKIGFLSVLISFIIGVSLGLMAGYYQDRNIKVNSIMLIINMFSFLTVTYMLWMECVVFLQNWYMFFAGMAGLIFLLIILGKILSKRLSGKMIFLPLDTILIKLIELRKSFPGIFLLLALISIFSMPSVWNIVIIISLLSWADFARLARGDTLSVINENYIISAKVLGIPDIRIIFRHILPNIMPTLIVAICFSAGSAVILESSLSFLGIGLPVEEVTWGKMMAEGRNMRYWWLVVFPGMAIFLLVLCLNTISNHWQKSNFTVLE